MNTEPKKKNEKPGSNFEEMVPEDKVDKGEKAVKKTEDKIYKKESPEFENPAKQRERGEQPVESVKDAPANSQN